VVTIGMRGIEDIIQQSDSELRRFEQRLRFPPIMEELFNVYYHQRSLSVLRVALVLAFLLYAGFGVLDIYMAPKSVHAIWIIRFAVVCPAIGLLFLMTFMRMFHSVKSLAVSLVVLLMGYGIIGMLVIADDPDTGQLYYAGLILVIMWACVLMRMRFRNASIVCWLIVLGYEYTAVVFLNMLESEGTVKIFISNNFFFISANIIGMISSYLIERSARRDFVNGLLLEERSRNIEFEKNELKSRDERIHKELVMARNIQQQLIPSRQPRDNIGSLYVPMEMVGGDFYDFIQFREENLIGIFISDVTGHGISSSLITAMIKSIILQAYSLKNDPAALLLHINRLLVNQTGGKFITAFYGIYDYRSGTMTYANAGHNPPYIITAGKAGILTVDACFPLAAFNGDDLKRFDKLYRNDTVTLQRGSKFFLYTDGFQEVPWPGGDEGIAGFLQSIHGLPCGEFIQTLHERLVKVNGTDMFQDDICLICIDV